LQSSTNRKLPGPWGISYSFLGGSMVLRQAMLWKRRPVSSRSDRQPCRTAALPWTSGTCSPRTPL